MTKDAKRQKVPLICADEHTVAGAEVFDQNAWDGDSKGIIQSCWNEYAVLDHSVQQILDFCRNGANHCQSQINALLAQWPFDLTKVEVFAHQPGLHMRIEAFLSGAKTLLDLLMQLLSTERVVGGVVDGFHRAHNEYGGKVLRMLDRNATAAGKTTAKAIGSLIREHKASWIDQIIYARDQLIHPGGGMHQLMFYFALAEKNGALVVQKISPPSMGSSPIDSFAPSVLKSAQRFSTEYLALLAKLRKIREAAIPT